MKHNKSSGTDILKAESICRVCIHSRIRGHGFKMHECLFEGFMWKYYINKECKGYEEDWIKVIKYGK